MEPNHDMLMDIFRMTKENNQMLHAMRRRALIGGFLKFVIWIALIFAPIWFYMTYVNASVQNLLHTMDQMRASGADAQAQLMAFQKTITDLEAKIPAFLRTPATSTATKTQ